MQAQHALPASTASAACCCAECSRTAACLAVRATAADDPITAAIKRSAETAAGSLQWQHSSVSGTDSEHCSPSYSHSQSASAAALSPATPSGSKGGSRNPISKLLAGGGHGACLLPRAALPLCSLLALSPSCMRTSLLLLLRPRALACQQQRPGLVIPALANVGIRGRRCCCRRTRARIALKAQHHRRQQPQCSSRVASRPEQPQRQGAGAGDRRSAAH